jgi:hypothetical protein
MVGHVLRFPRLIVIHLSLDMPDVHTDLKPSHVQSLSDSDVGMLQQNTVTFPHRSRSEPSLINHLPPSSDSSQLIRVATFSLLIAHSGHDHFAFT